MPTEQFDYWTGIMTSLRPRTASICCGGGIAEQGICEHFETAIAVDAWDAAVLTHGLNYPDVPVMMGSLLDHRFMRLVEGIVGPVDGLVGGPPCQGFSLAGDGVVLDERNDVFLAAINWVQHFEPRFVILENVVGLLRHPYLHLARVRLHRLGYDTRVWLLDAADYGTPQHRRRVFLIAMKDGLKMPEPPPATYGDGLLPYVTIGDAIRKIEEREALSLGCETLSPTRTWIMEGVPPGGNIGDLNGPRLEKALSGRDTINWGRCCRRHSWDEIHPTVRTGPSVLGVQFPLPPHRNRNYSVLEYLRLMGYQGDFHFGTRSISERYRIVGNGIPPPLISNVCQAVKAALL